MVVGAGTSRWADRVVPCLASATIFERIQPIVSTTNVFLFQYEPYISIVLLLFMHDGSSGQCYHFIQ